MQILPSEELLPYIKHYLFLRSEGNRIKKLRLFSDGNTGIVFTFNNNLIADFNNQVKLSSLPNTFVYGQLTEFKDIYLTGEISIIIVVFQPSGINQLLGLPADELQDIIAETAGLFGIHSIELHERLFEKPNIPDRLRLLNSFFKELINNKPVSNNSVIRASLNLIVQNKGLVTVNQLVRFTGYTERQIERKFMESIGLNPKMFINIVKLHSFLKYLKNKSDDNIITTLAYDAGYSDQSHLIREFKKYTGMTPVEYVKKENKLTVNFVEFLQSGISESPMSDLYNFHIAPKTNFISN